jgi:peroxiredoxin (alkyl hydroperoxide reductase subunit C)
MAFISGVFIIDKEGIIQYYTVNNLLCGRSVDELLRILQSIQYIKRIRPSLLDWKYGDKILYSHPLKSKVYFKTLYSHKKN